ncbi:Uncharacterised protein [Klebsiella pneumoniae]|uniref:Uncharacterized protein n=1 Tax=Klebsiella pneumoniae TaxID=573 RepID=A0A377TXC9_KLEPN|nr:Uncharacterised protein [Klebsiella pneumoniae]
MLWRKRRRRLASARANLAFSKEERDFAGSGFYRVGTWVPFSVKLSA